MGSLLIASFFAGGFILSRLLGGTVYLRYSYEAGTGRWVEDHKSELIIGVICAVIGAVLGAFATRFAEKIW